MSVVFMKDTELLFKVSDIGDGKGKGLVASKLLEAGEVIVVEEPLLVVHSTDNEDILKELVNASHEVKDRIMRLSDLGDLDLGCAEFFSDLTSSDNQHLNMGQADDMRTLETLMRKFRANMLGAPGEVEEDSCAVYDTICLINHRLGKFQKSI